MKMECQEKLEFLLQKYGVSVSGSLQPDGRALIMDGQEIPLLPWRAERRFIELKQMVDSKTVENVSVMRVCRIEPVGADFRRMLCRELDICQWILGDDAASVFAVQAGKTALNAAVTLSSGVVCTLELAATLRPGQAPIDKHEIISERGVACDRAVDTQVPQQSIYTFGACGEKTYLDTDFELFGCSPEETAVVRSAFGLLKEPQSAPQKIRENERLLQRADLILQSAKTGSVQEVSLCGR